MRNPVTEQLPPNKIYSMYAVNEQVKVMMTRKKTIGLVLICLLTVGIASVYAQEGKPFEGLNELWNAIFGVQEDIEDIQATLALHFEIADLRARVAALEALPPGGGTPGEPGPAGPKGDTGDTGLQGIEGIQGIQGIQGETGDTGPIGPIGSGLGPLIHDSEWNSITKGETLTICTLDDPDNVLVYMIGSTGSGGSHIMYYGSFMYQASYGLSQQGAYWFISDGVLKVRRCVNDGSWVYIRVLVWQLPPPTP